MIFFLPYQLTHTDSIMTDKITIKPHTIDEPAQKFSGIQYEHLPIFQNSGRRESQCGKDIADNPVHQGHLRFQLQGNDRGRVLLQDPADRDWEWGGKRGDCPPDLGYSTLWL